MATYKIWLTLKDRYGNLKEVDAGNIDMDLKDFTDDEIKNIEDTLLEKYVTDTELQSALDKLELEDSSSIYVPEVTDDNKLIFTLQEKATEERLEFDIDKSNDWNETDSTSGSNYIWEPMQ